jgi:hypothetical protein
VPTFTFESGSSPRGLIILQVPAGPAFDNCLQLEQIVGCSNDSRSGASKVKFGEPMSKICAITVWHPLRSHSYRELRSR